MLEQFDDAPALGRHGLEDRAPRGDVEQFTHQLAFAGVVGLVGDEEVGDLQDARLVHLHRVAHARHGDHRGAVDVLADRDVVLSGADGLDDQGLEAGAADQFDEVGKTTVVFADDREASVEDLLVDRVEVDPQAIAEKRAAGDRAHRIERDHRHRAAATRGFRGHRGHERALARAGASGDADDATRPLPRGLDRLAEPHAADRSRKLRGRVIGRDVAVGLRRLAHAVDDLLHRRAGVVDAVDARGDELRHVLLLDDAADVDDEIRPADLGALLEEARHEHEVGVAHHRARDHIDVLVAGGDREAAGRLPEAGVDDVGTAVAEEPGDELDAAVMAVEPGLAQEHPRTMVEIAAAVDLGKRGGGVEGRLGHGMGLPRFSGNSDEGADDSGGRAAILRT